ncbi:MAG TPA: LysM domain-containing protein [Solirubrobacteraceae bacterium]|nr:LysM domain-containing protein [Solirubrobacteraceae bacterium]
MEEIDLQYYVLPALLALLIVGTFLVIVTSGGGDAPAGAVDRPARTSTTATTSTSTSTTPATASSSGRFDKVRPGDTPTSIAERAGISTERLLELNPSIDPSGLKPGQTLKLAR